MPHARWDRSQEERSPLDIGPAFESLPALQKSPKESVDRGGQILGTMPTDLEKAMNSIINVYHKYSLEKGNYHSLYPSDMKKLLETECPDYVKRKSADTWFQELDINSDQALNFQEFLIFVVKIGVLGHKESHKE
ncbi:Protein S100-A8 [Galemys pyrenaicus]|uniref:Protein S100 n=1 Tax=Galemys pyrenaicus TaxID=202257 RepID=A0A8J6A483_GALPY|nr:Protein S100-A8 [Galemys pyrenaicus]